MNGFNRIKKLTDEEVSKLSGTSIMSKKQISFLRNIITQLEKPDSELHKLSGSDIAIRYKVVNGIINITPTLSNKFRKEVPYFIGLQL